MKQKEWLEEIEQEARATGFGKVTFEVTRHRNMTSKMEIIAHSKIKYVENERFFADLERLINNLIESRFTGKLQLEATFEGGNISNMTIKNKKLLNYRDKK